MVGRFALPHVLEALCQFRSVSSGAARPIAEDLPAACCAQSIKLQCWILVHGRDAGVTDTLRGHGRDCVENANTRHTAAIGSATAFCNAFRRTRPSHARPSRKRSFARRADVPEVLLMPRSLSSPTAGRYSNWRSNTSSRPGLKAGIRQRCCSRGRQSPAPGAHVTSAAALHSVTHDCTDIAMQLLTTIYWAAAGVPEAFIASAVAAVQAKVRDLPYDLAVALARALPRQDHQPAAHPAPRRTGGQ